MNDHELSNECTSSHIVEWEWRKVRRPAGGQKSGSPQARRFRFLPSRNPREPLTIKVKFRGGPECWYEVHARGSIARYPGTRSIHEIMDEINCGAAWPSHLHR